MQAIREKIMLPFSFCRFDADNPESLYISLKKNTKWLTLARIPYGYNLKCFLNEHIYNSDKRILIDGCNDSVAYELSDNGFEILKTGQEAILNLAYNHFKKKSLKELIRRGYRGKHFEEIPFSVKMKNRL